VTTSNCSNNYGPFHFPEKLIQLIITNILHEKPLPVYGDGLQIRDWLYVKNHTKGIELVLNDGRVGENYNIGGNNEWANIDIVKLLCKLMNEAFAKDLTLSDKYPLAKSAKSNNAHALITYVTARAGHDRRYSIETTKTYKELGYQPVESFETGLANTLRWYLINNAWWRPILAK
jgi:dTDP-glucose 4,6-dehydratase